MGKYLEMLEFVPDIFKIEEMCQWVVGKAYVHWCMFLVSIRPNTRFKNLL